MPTYIPSNDLWLCKNVGIIKNKHQRQFTSENEQINYFTSRSDKHETDFSYIKDDKAIRVDYNLEELRDYNYLVFKNDDFSGRYIFAFIVDMIYKAEETTYIYYDIDTYQTRLFDLTWKPSYIEREHCKLYNADGSPVINTLDEGLSYGNDYERITSYTYSTFNDVFFGVITSTVRLEEAVSGDNYEKGSVNGTQTPLNYYIVPMKRTSTGIITLKVNDGTPLSLDELFAMLNSERYANTVVSLAVTPFLPFSMEFNSNSNTITSSDLVYHVKTDGVKVVKPKDITKYKTLEIVFAGGGKYSPYDTEEESKLLMYPYTYAELTDLSGHKADIKLEYINNSNITFTIWSSVSHQTKYAVAIKGYNTGSNYSDYNSALINNTIHDIPIKTDMLASFMQSNRNAITMTNIMGGLQLAMGVGTLASLGGAGLVGAGSYLASEGSNTSGLNAMNQVGGLGGVSGGLSQILGTQAKIKDIDNVPPSINSMGNNTQFDYGNGLEGFRIVFYQIKPEYKKKLRSIFKMYGYKVNEVKLPNLHTRKSFNYVKTIDAVIQGSMSLPELNEIRNMFNNGMTLWHTDDIGNYNLGNEVI